MDANVTFVFYRLCSKLCDARDGCQDTFNDDDDELKTGLYTSC